MGNIDRDDSSTDGETCLNRAMELKQRIQTVTKIVMKRETTVPDQLLAMMFGPLCSHHRCKGDPALRLT
ncbi:hypothetical protein RRG08_049304 [Elysia crispata]|uniref:Uncharacterized protein n=1 Tax=Elysia crispata TaxID=231223 RepID=A0AAE1B2T1_9GAST|nr:hypothetical protein RRG08_049304 [Elysia crispata]